MTRPASEHARERVQRAECTIARLQPHSMDHTLTGEQLTALEHAETVRTLSSALTVLKSENEDLQQVNQNLRDSITVVEQESSKEVQRLLNERDQLRGLLIRARQWVPTNCGRWEGCDGSSGPVATPLAKEIDTALAVPSSEPADD